jgi:hypothetical protein
MQSGLYRIDRNRIECVHERQPRSGRLPRPTEFDIGRGLGLVFEERVRVRTSRQDQGLDGE